MGPFVVWWIKRDLRIGDNAALTAACRRANELGWAVLALYVYEPESCRAQEYHPRRDRFVHDCLLDLVPKLRKLNVQLWVASGKAAEVFTLLLTRGLKQVFSHEETGVLWTFERDVTLKKLFKEHDLEWQEFPTNGVVRGLHNRDEWQGLYQTRMSCAVEPVPQRVTKAGDTEAFGLAGTPTHGPVEFLPMDRAAAEGHLFKAAQTWTQQQQPGGETAAHQRLNLFLQPEVHRHYLASVSNPHDSQTYCSRLSPYLAFGCLSSKQILAKLRSPVDTPPWPYRSSLAAFRSRLAWRCHFIQKLENFPAMQEREQNTALAGLRPNMSAEELHRWQTGMTGYPLVDACLRSVHTTGFLNFRMRAMLMSFATHLLWRDWREPSWDLARAFLDFEPGIHFSQVQMQASVTGNNQIRIYNPLKQSAEHDPDASFIKSWVPELKDAIAEDIHQLRSLPAAYPQPITEPSESLAHARRVLFSRFKDDDVRSEAKKVQDQLGSRGGFSKRRPKSKKETPKESRLNPRPPRKAP